MQKQQQHIPPLFFQRFKHHLEPACTVDEELQTPVLQAMLSIPRHLFVDAAMQHRAYHDNALPIGYAQTISQPSMVACMTANLYHVIKNSLDSFNNILEIGTGSGYQSAILSKLWQHVYTIERIENLHHSATSKHQKINLNNIHYHYGDGHLGLAEHAPFEAIIVTACCIEIPPDIQNQLSVNGAIIAPVEYKDAQVLVLYQKKQRSDGTIKWQENIICEVKFVPMLSGVK